MKNVIFDLGGILIRFHPKEEIQKLNLSKDVSEILYKSIFCDGLWEDMDKGIYSGISETLPIYLERYPELKDEILMFFHEGWEDMFELLKGGYSFLQEVRQLGCHCYVLSNYPREMFSYTENRYSNVFEQFDGMVISGRIKIAKPDQQIFQYLIDTYHLNKEDCIFFDDTLKNVEASNQFGILAYQYQDPIQAMNDLKKML